MMTTTTTKKCTTCGESKARGDFVVYHSGPKAGTLKSSQCRDCFRESERSRASRFADVVARSRDAIVEALSGGCVDCGERDPLVLEFDHREPHLKSFNIGRALGAGRSIRKLRDEMAKCDVVCANCHARRTAVRANSWRLYLVTQ